MASNTENLNLLMKNPSTDGADTFNIDTMLNENWRKIDANAGSVAKTLANILKPTTPPIIGLPPSTTPDGMFQALGNTGELHVWRKAVVTDKAGYNLGSPEGSFLASGSGQNSNNIKFTVYYSSSISVSDVGEAVLVSPKNVTYAYNSENSSDFQQRIRGKFIKIELQLYVGYPQRAPGSLMFIPTDATLSYITSGTSLGYPYDYCYIVDKMQKVQPYGVRTTITYPVSVNPNAYQEGSDAKPAGYVVGDVVTSKVKLGYSRLSSEMFYYYADTLSVSDDGKVSISTQNSYQVNRNSSTSELKAAMAGKFLQLYGSSGSAIELSGPFSTIPGEIVFIPADTSFNTETIRGDDYFTIDRYQPVTGYAAIPAGTTIEYLGKLGDKASVQVVSYVGTGTYGSGHKNSLTFDFVPKLVIVALSKDKSNNPNVMPSPKEGWSNMFLWIYGMKTTKTSSSELHFINDGKILSWYAYNYASNQCNESGSAYTAVAIG